MHPATSTVLNLNEPLKTPCYVRLRKQWSTWAWIALLAVVNLPLLRGEIRMELLFIPDAIDMGQWWRTVTYPLVHLSGYHLLLDAGGFLLLYPYLEEKRMPAKALYIMGASAGSLLLTLALCPSIFQQGLSGLSGIAHGLMAITALEMLRHKDQRTWGWASLAVVVSKSAYELWSGQVLFDFMHMGLCGQPMATSHAGGVMGGVLSFMLVGLWTERRSRTVNPHAKRKGPPDADCDAADRVDPSPQPSTAQHLLRRLAIALTRIMYRVRYDGIQHIPRKGPAVLVCNHVSYVDALIIAGACNRPVHFVMHAAIYQTPLLRWLFRMAGVIPIDSGRKNPALLRQAFKDIAGILRSGGVICIFPEGSLTRTGQIGRFRPGIETIVRQTPVPVIPLALRGLWGSFFSRKGGPAMRRRPHKIRARIELAAGLGVPPQQASAHNLQCAVQALRGDMT